jgi:hypothetical protein
MNTSNVNKLQVTVDLIKLRDAWLHELHIREYKKYTMRQFLNISGARRANERKINGVWVTDLIIYNQKKWLLTKIKYGL